VALSVELIMKTVNTKNVRK